MQKLMNMTLYNLEFSQKKAKSHHDKYSQSVNPQPEKKIEKLSSKYPRVTSISIEKREQKKSVLKPSEPLQKVMQTPRIAQISSRQELHSASTNQIRKTQEKKKKPESEIITAKSLKKKVIEEPIVKPKKIAEVRPETSKKWEEERRKMKEQIERQKKGTKKVQREVPFCLIERSFTSDQQSTKMELIENVDSSMKATKSSKAFKTQKSELHNESQFKEEIKKMKQINKEKTQGGKKTLDQFSEKDVLVNGLGVKNQVEILAENIKKKQKKEELLQEDMQNLVVEMKNVITHY